MATELSNGQLMMNSRNQRGDIRSRIVAVSNSGGEHWDTVYFDHNLPDPVCQGSILTLGKEGKKNILAFCNAADTVHRDNLTLRISFDDGRNWHKQYMIDKSDGKTTEGQAAYSDLVILDKKTIGILYERNNYQQIVFVRRRWSK